MGNNIIFAEGSVPVATAAKVYGKDASWVRAGIIAGWLPIGTATRRGRRITTIEEMDSKLGRINYYISPKLLWEQTGYIWKGDKNHGNETGIVSEEWVLDREAQVL